MVSRGGMNIQNRLKKKRVAFAEIISCVTVVVVYSIYRDWNTMRFQNGRVDATKTYHDIAMHLRIQGRNKAS